ncbi:hypothetical protein L873DRAFT_1718600 [Choiromyces venosus 120613-1]|uniref:N-acetyltransferase domain-containing protein n=1 Tax=Choiromyces venosus 120613-1 TaxID=1336337 RepID=A0A3N4IZ24_9PEZI|nr:hypothetical protein L873DRAFT_1718600 [Choiromyces venosus 120613-1]
MTTTTPSTDPPLPDLTFTPIPPTSEQFLPAYTLLTDSIAQYRSTLTLSLLYSRPLLTVPPTVLAAAYLLHSQDLSMAVILFVGYVIAVLSACGYLSYGYIERAEWMASRSGLGATLGGGREVVGAFWGEEVIGVVVFERGQDGEAVIYGWAVRLRYRGKGVGRGLLEKVAEMCGGRVRFAEDHVHSYRLPRVPAMFNKVFDKREAKAKSMLEDVLKSQ